MRMCRLYCVCAGCTAYVRMCRMYRVCAYVQVVPRMCVCIGCTAYVRMCRLYQAHLKDSHEKVRHKAAAAKQVANQPNKGGSGREASLRAAIMAPLSPNVAPFSNKAGKLQPPRQTRSTDPVAHAVTLA